MLNKNAEKFSYSNGEYLQCIYELCKWEFMLGINKLIPVLNDILFEVSIPVGVHEIDDFEEKATVVREWKIDPQIISNDKISPHSKALYSGLSKLAGNETDIVVDYQNIMSASGIDECGLVKGILELSRFGIMIADTEYAVDDVKKCKYKCLKFQLKDAFTNYRFSEEI